MVLALLASTAAGASTLERVRAAKELRCGVNTEEGDYSRSDDHGARVAFDADLCRAVGVAILGPSAKVVLTEVPDDSAGMEALRAGKVDLLPTLTKDFSHTTGTGIGFSGVVLWDGVGLMVPMGSPVKRAEELAGKTICLLEGTEVEETIGDWFRGRGLEYDPFPFQEEGEMEAAFVVGGCAAMAGDLTRLASVRVGFGPLAAKFRLMEGEPMSKDPLAAAYIREGDGRFGEIVDWVVEVLVRAEEMGATAKAVRRVGREDASTRRLTGRSHELGARLGLADGWAMMVLEAVGNYGEMVERDLGQGSAMGLPRGWNSLAKDGGLMVALPLK